MKRRILSILCALALCLGLLPTVALAGNPTTLTVGGTDVQSGGYWKTNTDGTLTADMASADNYNVYYDGDGTLTLKDATINGTNTIGHVGAGIFASGDLTIVLEGSSTVKGVQDPNGESQSIRVSENLTIQGGGSLTAQGAETSSGSSYGIFVIGSFTQQGGSVTASGGDVSGSYNSTGLYVYGSTVTVQGGTLTATGGTTGSGSYGISANGSVTVSDATVTATSGSAGYASYGLYIGSSSPSVTLSGSSSLTARSGTATNRAGGIYFQNPFGSAGSVTVGENSTLLANSVILYDNSFEAKPLAPTGDGSWLIYGQSGQTSAVGGNYTLTDDLTIENGNTFTIPAGSTLNLGGHTLTVDGTLNIANQSSLAGEGTLAGDSGTYTMTNPDPVISGSETLTYDGTDQFSKFKLEAPTGTVEVMGKDFTISSSPSLDGWNLVEQEIINAGSYTLTASNGTTTIEKEITVSPATISITGATLTPKTYDGNNTATVESVTFDNLVNGESLSLGTDYTATATFADKNVDDSKSATVTVTLADTVKNYTLASDDTTATGTISPLPVVLNWGTTSFTYDGTEKTVTAEVSNAVDGDNFNLAYTGNTGTAVNSYTATVTSLGNDNYTLTGATGTTQAWSIGEASIAGATVELSETEFTYTGQSQKPTVTVKLGDTPLTADDYDVTYSGESINAGNYTVTVTGKGNYSGTANSQPTYTINKADQAALSITSSGPATYGQDYALTTSGGSGSGAVTITVSNGTGAATVSGYTLTPTKAGTVTVTAVKAGDNNYNDGTSVSVTITINKGTYDGTKTAAGSVLANWSGEVELPGIPDGASYGTPTSSDVTGLSITDGNILHYTGGSGIVKDQTYTVTVPVTGATNYDDYNITVTLTGTDKQVLTITGVTAQNGTYNGQTQAGYTGTPSADGYTGDFTVTYNTTDGKAPTNAGTYTVTIAIPDSDPQYVGSIVLEFTIAQKPLTVSAPSPSVYVGGSAPELALTYTGLVAGESVTPSEAPVFTITKADGTVIALDEAVKTAGTYTITWSNADSTTFPDGANYAIQTETTGTLTVSPRSTGGSGVTTYLVDVEDAADGEVKSSHSRASQGTTVTLIVIPDEGYELASLTITKSSGEDVKFTDKGNGKFTFTMPSGNVTVEAVFTEITPAPLPFTDVAENAWYAEAVRYVYEHGLMTGTSATTFAPNATTSRSMIATILWRMAGSPVVNYAMDYADVAQGQWYSEAIRWAASEGIVGGYGNGLFGTNDPITREQLVTMLYRYAQAKGYDTTQGGMAIREYADFEQISGYAVEAMTWAVNTGIINGTSSTTLSPQGAATRAQVATILMRFIEGMA